MVGSIASINTHPIHSRPLSNLLCKAVRSREKREVPRAMAAFRSDGAVTFSLETPCCEEEPVRLLGACFLCGTRLAADAEVFMYRGDTPFCNVECRLEQIELDEAREREMRYRRRRVAHRRRASLVEQPAPSALSAKPVAAS